MELTADKEDPVAHNIIGRPSSGRQAGVLNYTSGTTGRPKGVMASSQAMTMRNDAYQDAFCYTPQDRVGVTVPVASATHKLGERAKPMPSCTRHPNIYIQVLHCSL